MSELTDGVAAVNARSGRDRLAFRKVDVRKAPGIDPGYAIRDLSPDINIVYGPNASGKSTTARAIQALIWPHPSSLRGHALAGDFQLDGECWHVEADAGRVVRSRGGETADPPRLAPIDDRVRYTLGLPDLLASENEPLAEAILKESTGGFDLDAIARARGYRSDLPVRLEASRDVDSAAMRVREAERGQQETALQDRHLTHLRERERRARQAGTDAAHLRAALAFARARFERDRAASALAAFPAALAHATGDEAARIAELGERLGTLADRRRELDAALNQAEEEQRATGLVDVTIDQSVLRSMRGAAAELARLDAEIASLQRDLQTAAAERDSHRRRLAADLTEAQVNALDTEGLRELAQLARDYADIRVQRQARAEVERWLGGVRPPANLDALRRGTDALVRRLQTPNAVEAGIIAARARWAAYVGGILVILAAIWLAALVHPAWSLFALLGVLLIVYAWRYALSAQALEADRLEAEYRQTGLAEPAGWTLPNIRARADELQVELTAALVEQEKANRWGDLEERRQALDRAYHEVEARRAAVIHRYGVAPDLDEDSLRLLAENLSRWQAADGRVRAAQGRLNAVGKERLVRDTALREGLGRFGYSGGAFAAQLDDLERRLDALAAATARVEERRREVAGTLQPEIDRVERQRAALYERLDVSPGDERALHERLGQLGAYRDALELRDEREAALRSAEEALALAPELKDIPPEQLQRRLEAAETSAAELEPVLREIAAVQTRIGDAKRKHDVEEALARRDDARDRLRATRDEIAGQVVGDTLLAYIRAETRDAALPIVFHRARELFTIITRGRYELQFEEGPPPAFTARDTTTGLTLALDQLSSGTRVQVLMAIRLAFVENVEWGPKLPILLDETLGNSDELRAGAIIDAAIEIARNGRQVFYFTAQGDEVLRWQHRLEQIPADDRPSSTIIDLAEVRRAAGFERLPLNATETLPDRLSVPAPNGISRREYGTALQVPGLNPWADGIGGIHLWHVVTDSEALRRLLEQDVRTWGQLAGLTNVGGRAGLVALGLDEPALRRLAARAGLIEAAVEMWRIGRSHPVPARDLVESGLLPDEGHDDALSLLPTVEGDGERLMARLREGAVSQLDTDAVDRLETWLATSGFLATGEPLTAETLRARVLASVAPAIERGDLSLRDVDEVLGQLPRG